MRVRHLPAVALLLLVLLPTDGCAPGPGTRVAGSVESSQVPVPVTSGVKTVEVRDFRGKRLDALTAQPETSIGGPQKVDVRTFRLSIFGKVRRPIVLTYAEVLALPAYQEVTTLHCVEGWSVTHLWQGVRLIDLLKKADYDSSASTLIFRCYDGYFVSIPLEYVARRDILLAYRVNGLVLAPSRGYPFQVVAEDRYGYKWAKWVTSIEATDNAGFRGYWERVGYDNTAIVPGGRP